MLLDESQSSQWGGQDKCIVGYSIAQCGLCFAFWQMLSRFSMYTENLHTRHSTHYIFQD